MTPSSAHPYRVTAPGAESPLRQGEILTGVQLFRLVVASIGTETVTGEPSEHPYAIILTQDCDLEQDFKARSSGKISNQLVPTVLFAEVETAIELRGTTGITSDMWRRISQNNDIRYHFLQKVEPGFDQLEQGLPELAIDFKRYFTLPVAEIYRRIEIREAMRRCVLVSPYLEHLSSRFAHYLSRVGLPEGHFSEPGGAGGR